MVYLSNLSKCTLKSMVYCFLLIIIYVSLHSLFENYILNFAYHSATNSIFSITKRLRKPQSSDLKYILLWSKYSHYIQFKGGKVIHPSLKCSISNCVFTKDKGLFDGDYTRFDAVLFNEEILLTGNKPERRVPLQIYVFNALESSYTVPACKPKHDGFFNWTLTYRLDSDILWSYFIVRNLKGAIVAPRTTMRWQRSLRPVDSKIKTILAGKSKAAAWLVSHCKADSLRDEYLTRLQEHLFHFALKIDVYGKCTHVECTRGDCDEMIKKDYYFYMAFENSFAEDYVTEKVLHGYENYAVPIVYGGANYSR
ncbi:jg7269 [Pararge aegeria aegeria]|uniref:Fucosyltransferase n=1 Tax=Pararge aegeria aegeria TaxID=348720 RepID=A0A8S4SA29_9NEOP|nr:jg7269 [Pararge aegeria aegeria]